MKFVKQADTYHLVEDDAKPEPARVTTPDGLERVDGRPALRAKCGAFVHTGKLDQPIDDGDHCKACESS